MLCHLPALCFNAVITNVRIELPIVYFFHYSLNQSGNYLHVFSTWIIKRKRDFLAPTLLCSQTVVRNKFDDSHFVLRVVLEEISDLAKFVLHTFTKNTEINKTVYPYVSESFAIITEGRPWVMPVANNSPRISNYIIHAINSINVFLCANRIPNAEKIYIHCYKHRSSVI